MTSFLLLIKGGPMAARREAIRRGCEILRAIELPEPNTVVLVKTDVLKLHRWYAGDERERAMVRAAKPLPAGALLYFREDRGAADVAPANTPEAPS